MESRDSALRCLRVKKFVNQPVVVQVAVPSPLLRTFDYLWPLPQAPQPGIRVRVPFGRREVVGVVYGTEASTLAPSQLKAVLAALDEAPVLPPELLALTQWAARYYHHPPGEVLATALPTLLRQGEPAVPSRMTRWRRVAGVEAALSARAERQRALLALLEAHPEGLTTDALGQLQPGWQKPMQVLAERGLAVCEVTSDYRLTQGQALTTAPELSPEQLSACEAIAAQRGAFATFLLDGVTGSGKTEVYLHAIANALAADCQVLVLVPEIGLTPQLVERFSRRFSVGIAVFHSGLSERERLDSWLAARDGAAAIVLGTRSAVFTPLARPGLIIVDEEHDASFKQQEGFRYNGRDLAIVRASRLGIPIVLGSATPSLESLHNAQRGRYRHLQLPRRAGGARPPSVRLLDIRGRPLAGGLSEPLLAEVQRHLEADGQVLIFLNRRGFAPTLLCHACGWVAGCPRCDARLTLHQRAGRLRCHHCGHERRIVPQCEACQSTELLAIGQGTERVEQVLAERFPGERLLRIDRDSTRRKGSLADLLEQARRGEGRLLLGTQMLAKGHHLPDVTLVAIVDADQGLFGADFRAPERMAQLIVQVAGRAGRESRPGEVIIQTHHPEHPLLQTLVRDGYGRFAAEDLALRRSVELPPYTALALLRAEAPQASPPHDFLRAARAQAEALGHPGVRLLGPLPAPMERRAGRFRAQLLLQAAERSNLHRLLDRWVGELSSLPSARKVRWSLDVDPVDTL